MKIGLSESPLADFLYDDPPMIWFANGASLEGNTYTPLKTVYPPYPREKIVHWTWTGIDLRVESQGVEKRADSIQYRVIQELKARDYAIVFDDDGAGEAADIVAVKIEDGARGRAIVVEFYHCKYSKQEAGKRIKDLYEVCGQAQKSIQWMANEDKKTGAVHSFAQTRCQEKGSSGEIANRDRRLGETRGRSGNEPNAAS